MAGFQWLLTKHFQRGSCILADDMGLGKTCVLMLLLPAFRQRDDLLICRIQIASVLGYLGSEKLKIYPLLVVVPNS